MLFVLSSCSYAQNDRLTSETITVDGRTRTYYMYLPSFLPKDKSVPLVLVFHGGGGNGVGTSRLTKFNQLADKENFIAVYPNGVGGNWNDGREDFGVEAFKEKVNDVAFVKALIDAVSKEYKIDAKRIYATGISNGAIFSHYLAANMADRIAAVAPVVGGIADPFYKNFKPSGPVSVLIIQGTADPLVPYDGGDIARNRGKIIGTDAAVKLWLKNNRAKEQPPKTESFDRDKTDPCTVDTYLWSGGSGKTEVMLYKLNGGGHTWPGSIQYAARVAIGDVCKDIDATEVIWDFFKRHPKAGG